MRKVLVIGLVGLAGVVLGYRLSRLQPAAQGASEPHPAAPADLPRPVLRGRADMREGRPAPRLSTEAAPLSADGSPDLSRLAEDPELTLQTIAGWDLDPDRVSDAQLREMAHYYALAVLKLYNTLTEDDEQYEALLRLRSAEQLAQRAGVELSEAERRTIDSIAEKYSQRLKELVPVAAAEANREAIEQFERREYTVRRGADEVVSAATPYEGPRGAYSWVTTIGCLKTPYSISFTFDSGQYPALDVLFQQIKDTKQQMEDEVLQYLSALR